MKSNVISTCKEMSRYIFTCMQKKTLPFAKCQDIYGYDLQINPNVLHIVAIGRIKHKYWAHPISTISKLPLTFSTFPKYLSIVQNWGILVKFETLGLLNG